MISDRGCSTYDISNPMFRVWSIISKGLIQVRDQIFNVFDPD